MTEYEKDPKEVHVAAATPVGCLPAVFLGLLMLLGLRRAR